MPEVSADSVSPTCAVPLMVGTPVAGVLAGWSLDFSRGNNAYMDYLAVLPIDVHLVPFEAAVAGAIRRKIQGEAADLQGVVRSVGNAFLKRQAKVAARYVGPKRLDLQVPASAHVGEEVGAGCAD